MARGRRLWGETLNAGRPSVEQNRTAVAAATAAGTAEQQQQAAAPDSGANSLSTGSGSTERVCEEDLLSTSSTSCCASSLINGETWLVLEYANKGCLQVRQRPHTFASS
jgi:hypothetical protein